MADKKKILIVDDEEINRVILTLAFEDKYEVVSAKDGVEALDCIGRYKKDICAVLLDIIMPEKDGYEVLSHIKEQGILDKMPVFLITSETNLAILEKGFVLGASDIISKPFNPSFIRRRIDNVVELYEHRLDLQSIIDRQVELLKTQEKELISANRSIIDTLSTAIEFRDCESGAHITRIRDITKTVLYSMIKSGKIDMDKHTVELIGDAAVMHDVGKISIPDNILNKPGRLTPEEYEIMKQHTMRGCELLEQIDVLKRSEIYSYCYDICRHHHERWDGNGYPDKLKGEDISLWAQVVSLADVFDALVSERVYKRAYSYDEAMHMIYDGQCGVFNPEILESFSEVSEELYSQYKVKDYA